MTTPTNEFPLETPCPVPACLTSLAFIPNPFDPQQQVLVIRQEGSRAGVDVFLTEHNFKEIAQIADGRLVNRMMSLTQDVIGIALDDQTMSFIRDNERLLTEYVLSDGRLDAKERLLISLIQACVLLSVKLVRSQE